MNISKILNSADESRKCDQKETSLSEEQPADRASSVKSETEITEVSRSTVSSPSRQKIDVQDAETTSVRRALTDRDTSKEEGGISSKIRSTEQSHGQTKRIASSFQNPEAETFSRSGTRSEKYRRVTEYSAGPPVSIPVSPPVISTTSPTVGLPSPSALHYLSSEQSQPETKTAAFSVQQTLASHADSFNSPDASYSRASLTSTTSDLAQGDAEEDYRDTGSTNTNTAQGSPSKRAVKSKRSKAKNTQWTLEEDRRLVDLVLSTLPTQDFGEYARHLNKRDANTVRYRWKVLVRRAKGEGSILNT